MNNIGLTLTADARQMIKALQDVDKATTAALGHSAASARQLEQAARDAGIAMGGMASNANIRQMDTLSKQVDQLGLSSKQTAAALRGVPAQFTDIVVSLQGGQNPLTVLLQQGGQLKDMFGGIGPAVRALGGYVVSIINPFTLAATAVAALGAAMHQVSKEQQMLRDSIALTGGASGVTTDQLNAMAERMAQGFGATTGKAIESLAAMNQTGRIARANLEDFAQTAIIVEKRFGQTIEETAKNFAELGKDPVGASKRLNESMNFLTASTYEQIRAAVELGDKTKAATIAQSEYEKALRQMSQSAVENLGYLEKAWRAITGGIKSAWNVLKEFGDLLKSVGRDDSTAVQIQKIEAELALVDKGLRNMSARQVEALRAQLEGLRETEKLAKLAGDKQAERVAAEKAGIAAIDEAEKNREKNRRIAEDAAKKAAKEAAEARKAELAVGELRNKLAEENAKREAKQIEETAKREAEGLKITNQLREDSIKPFEQALKAQQKRVESLEQEEAAIAISEKMNVSLAQAVEMVNIARLEEMKTAARAAENFDAVEMIQKEIEEREKLVKLIGSKEARDASAKAAKQAADDWKKASDKIQDSITDALMRGFENGKGFVKNLVDTIKNMFNTMVLRPIVQAVVGSAASMLGLPASATSAGGSALNSLSTANSLYSMGSTALTLGGQYAAGTMSAANVGATMFGNAAAPVFGGSMEAMLAANGAFGTAGGAGATASAGSSMMANAAAAGPYVAAALVVLNALGAFRSKKVVGGGLMGTLGQGDIQSYDLQRRGGTLFNGPSYSIVNQRTSPESKALQDAFLAMRGATAAMAEQLGVANDAILTFTTRLGSDLIHPDTGGYGIKLDGLNPEQAAAKVQQALEAANEEMARQVLGTFETVKSVTGGFFKRAVETQKWIDGPFVRDGETAAQALVRLSSSLTVVNRAFDLLDRRLMDLSLSGADAASKLLDLMGGLAEFEKSTGAYYQAFYTEAERNARAAQAIGQAMKSMGMAMPETLAGFRALVDAQDLTTDSGRKAYVALMQLAPAFAQVVASMTTAVTQAMGAAAPLLQKQITASQDAANAAREMADAYKSAAVTMRETGESLLLQSAGAAQTRAMVVADYRRTMAAAQAGDLTAMGNASGAASTFVEQSRLGASTRVQFMLAAAQARADLELAAQAASTEGQRKDYQALIYDTNTRLLEEAQANLQQQSVNQQLLADQIQALKDIDAILRDSNDLTADALFVQDMTAIKTSSSSATLGDVLRVLSEPPAWAMQLLDLTKLSNQPVVDALALVQAAINQQSMAQRAEIKRQQDLAKAQEALESLATSGTQERLNAAQQTILQKEQQKSEYDRQIAVVAPNFNKWSYGVRWNFDNVWKPGSANLAKEIPAMRQQMIAEQQAYNAELERQREAIRALGGIPAFATGGVHMGGIRLVGENGPELEVTGPSRIFNAQQTAGLLGGGDAASEIRAMREELAMLRAEARATAINTGRQADLMKRVTKNGEAMTVQTDLTPLEVTTA